MYKYTIYTRQKTGRDLRKIITPEKPAGNKNNNQNNTEYNYRKKKGSRELAEAD